MWSKPTTSSNETRWSIGPLRVFKALRMRPYPFEFREERCRSMLKFQFSKRGGRGGRKGPIHLLNVGLSPPLVEARFAQGKKNCTLASGDDRL